MSRSFMPLASSACVTLGFVGCAGETQVLNSADAGAGGQEGDGLGPPTGGSFAAGKAGGENHAGTGGGAASGSGGSLPGTGGAVVAVPSSGAAGSAGSTGGSRAGSGSVVGGSGGSPTGGAGASAGAPMGGLGGTTGIGASAGSSGAGSPNGGVGNTGNTGGRGSAGAAGEPEPGACNSSTGSTCAANRFCVDLAADSCDPDTSPDCKGACASSVPAPACFGIDSCPGLMLCLPSEVSDRSQCVGADTPTCSTEADCPQGFTCAMGACDPIRVACGNVGSCVDHQLAACPAGYARAQTELCATPCVPIPTCGCTRDADCPYPSSCDRVHGHCALAEQAPGCSMAYDPGPCDGNESVFAYIDGSCRAVGYGGCEGNDNRFATIEECLLRCENLPLVGGCPAGRVAAHVCLACGAGGGCVTLGDFCAERCESDLDCTTGGQTCYDGVCQVIGCT